VKDLFICLGLTCVGIGVAVAIIPHDQPQVQAAPAVQADPQPTYQHITSLPFDAATYNMNQADYPSVDGPDPAKLWDASDGSTARSAEGWDGTSPSLPGNVTNGKAGPTGKSGTSSTGSTSKAGKVTPSKSVAPKIPTAPKVPQGTKGALATPQTLSQGPSVKPVRIPLY
jgi:hypothetical protein